MLKAYEQWLAKAQWLPTQHQLGTWAQEGIEHGFEGLGFQKPAAAFSLKQVHGIVLKEITAAMNSAEESEGDGLWTRDTRLTLAVKTADCVPVLVYHPKLVMALHAGWKGLAQDILGEAIKLIELHGLQLGACRFAIGPCISAASFEIGAEVVETFRREAYALDDETWALAISKGEYDRWHLDLGTLAALRLQRAGCKPEQVSVVRSCTQRQPLLWHSFRRDGARAGRNWSWICRR